MRIKWTKQEDERCREAVYNILKQKNWLHKYKTTEKLFFGLKWKDVALKVKTRNAKQCRERYVNQLSPYINRKEWTKEEDKLLLSLFLELDTNWKQMEKSFVKRPANMIKMRWKALKRKQKYSSLNLNRATFLEINEKCEIKSTEKLKEVSDFKFEEFFDELFIFQDENVNICKQVKGNFTSNNESIDEILSVLAK